MCVTFLKSIMDNLTKDFKKEMRNDRKNTYNNKSYGNDYLIRKEEYGTIYNYLYK